MSKLSDMGISITARTPIFSGTQRNVDTNLHRELTSYSHELLANGGYWASDIEFAANKPLAEDWLARGVGRDIIVRNSAGTLIFRGVVNVVTATVGGVEFTRGTLLEITNQLQVIYQTVVYQTNPPVGGSRQQGGLKSNAASQDAYGVMHTYLSGGVGNTLEMDAFGDNFINERSQLQSGLLFNLAATAVPTIKLEIIGYVQLMAKYPYVQIVNSGTENASTKIQNILMADPNGLYTDFSKIQVNTTQVPQFENEQADAWEILKDVVARGDGSGNRWVFRIMGDLVPYYEPAPTAVEYTYKIADKEPRLSTKSGRVDPWDVKPGKWTMVTDWLIGDAVADLERDPRTSFIESVRYSSVWGLQIDGSKDGRLGQQMAKLGLGGTF